MAIPQATDAQEDGKQKAVHRPCFYSSPYEDERLPYVLLAGRGYLRLMRNEHAALVDPFYHAD